MATTPAQDAALIAALKTWVVAAAPAGVPGPAGPAGPQGPVGPAGGTTPVPTPTPVPVPVPVPTPVPVPVPTPTPVPIGTDGSAGAPAGTPQRPTMLNGMLVRPPWKVAGVDYHTGIPAGTVLKDKNTISMPGVEVDTAHHLIRVTGNNVTLDGYDFSGSWTVYVSGNAPTNTVIKNCALRNGSVVFGDPSSVNVSVLSCDFDGGGSSFSSFITLSGTGKKTIQYNWMANSPQHFLELNNGGTLDYRFNLLEEGGRDPGAHLNFSQFQGGALNAAYNNPVIAFNTILQHPQAAGGEGFQFGPKTFGAIANNNTLVAVFVGKSAMSYMLNASNPGEATTATIKDNYVAGLPTNFPAPNTAGAFGFLYPPASGNVITLSGNIDMMTGKTILANNSEV